MRCGPVDLDVNVGGIVVPGTACVILSVVVLVDEDGPAGQPQLAGILGAIAVLVVEDGAADVPSDGINADIFIELNYGKKSNFFK